MRNKDLVSKKLQQSFHHASWVVPRTRTFVLSYSSKKRRNPSLAAKKKWVSTTKHKSIFLTNKFVLTSKELLIYLSLSFPKMLSHFLKYFLSIISPYIFLYTRHLMEKKIRKCKYIGFNHIIFLFYESHLYIYKNNTVATLGSIEK